MISERHLKRATILKETPDIKYAAEQMRLASILYEKATLVYHRQFSDANEFCDYVLSHNFEFLDCHLPYETADGFRLAAESGKFELLFHPYISDEELKKWEADYKAGKTSI